MSSPPPLELVRESAPIGRQFKVETRLRDTPSHVENRSGWRIRPRIPRRELLNFCFHLEQLTRAGLPLLDGLRDLGESIEHAGLRCAVICLGDDLSSGQTLSQAMSAHPAVFDTVFISLIRAGEASGRLPEMLASLGEMLKWQDELAAQNRRLLLYPCFVGAVTGGATLFLMLHVVPQLRPFVQNMGQSLPLHTQLLFFIAEQLASHWLAMLATTLSATGIFLTLLGLPEVRLRFDALKLRLPLLGRLIEKTVMARFASTLALLYDAGIPIMTAIDIAREVVGNRSIHRALPGIADAIRNGSGITAAFAQTGRFPPLVTRMLHIGEQTGNLDAALRNVAYFYVRDVREGVARLQSMIEPTLTVIMGLLLGWVMLSVIGPVYDSIARIRP